RCQRCKSATRHGRGRSSTKVDIPATTKRPWPDRDSLAEFERRSKMDATHLRRNPGTSKGPLRVSAVHEVARWKELVHRSSFCCAIANPSVKTRDAAWPFRLRLAG